MTSPDNEPRVLHLPLAFHDYPGSYALVSSDNDTDTAVVFVHGFMGDAIETWQEFQPLADSPRHSDAFARADLFFYSYPSIRHTIKVATERFEKFLGQVTQGPWNSAVDPRIREAFQFETQRRSYRRLVLVGHSLGGVLVRNAISKAADALKSQPGPWPLLLGTAPQLFAPAHSGFKHDGVLSAAAGLNPLAAFIFVYWRFRHAKVYADLKSGSQPLEKLQSRTMEARKAHPHCPALYADVLWGDDENVVFDTDYTEDRTRDSVAGKTHTTICKPSDDFIDPLTMVTDVLV